MRLILRAVVLCLGTTVAPLLAQTDAERELELRETQQRERIAQDRAQYSAQFRAREIACYQRFAVNDCLNESRRTERGLLADLRRQEVLINDAQRKRRAAAQMMRADERLHGAGQP